MKYAIIASACAALLATPALAQSVSGYDQPTGPAASSAAPQGCSTIPDAKGSDACPSSLTTAPPPAPDLPLSVVAERATGMIASIDVAANSITLDNGKTFEVPMNFAVNDLKVGQTVTIAFARQDGKLRAREVITAPSGAPAKN